MRIFWAIILVISVLVSACGVKRIEKSLNVGDYDTVVYEVVNKLGTNKNSKKNQEYIILLEQAYAKAMERDLGTINFLKQDNNPAQFEKVYETYVSLKERQEKIKPLLPLYVIEKGHNASFVINNYDTDIISYKNKVSEYLYTKAEEALKRITFKQDYRNVYNDLIYLDKINPSYRNTKQLILEARAKGIDYIKIEMRNSTDKVIPKRLENDLFNMDTYGLNNLWTVYHSNFQPSLKYDYTMLVDFRSIQITPEKVSERQLQRQKVIVDGWEYLLNKQGEVVKNEKGQKIKVDKKRTITCEYYEFTQFKSVQVGGIVSFTNNTTKQQVDTFPINSEFIFEHIYANYSGDKRALETDLVRYLGLQAVQFPSNEQMIYDSGEQLKSNIKSILQRQRF